MTRKLEWGSIAPSRWAHSQSRGITTPASVTSAELSVLSGAGATSVESSGGVPVDVHAPQGNINVTVPLRVPRTAVPASRIAEI
jgi:hypothetical protein